jgi:IclR family KDG regulon transcriptional repressor
VRYEWGKRAEMSENEYSISSLEAALDVAECFITSTGPVRGVSEISRQTGLHKTRVFRILSTLTKRGYIEQDPETQKYRLGSRFLVLGEAYRNSVDLRNIALPFMTQLAKESGDAAHLFVPSGDRALCLDVRLGDHVVQAATRVGDRLGYNVGAAPKILLAFMPEPAISKMLNEMEFIQYSPRTITARAELEGILAQIRTQGYCVAEEDYELNTFAIGAPICNHTGEVIAAMSIAIPQSRYNHDLQMTKLRLVLDIVAQLNKKLGYRGEIPSTGVQ